MVNPEDMNAEDIKNTESTETKIDKEFELPEFLKGWNKPEFIDSEKIEANAVRALEGLAVLAVAGITYKLVKGQIKALGYWKEKNVPYVKSYPFVGSLPSLFRTQVHETELSRYKKLGPIYGSFEGTKPTITVGHPIFLNEILTKDFEFFCNRRPSGTKDAILDNILSFTNYKNWKRMRPLIQSTLSADIIKKSFFVVKDCSRTLVENFKLYGKSEPVDVRKFYGAFTLDVISTAGFSKKIVNYKDPDNKIAKSARENLVWALNWRFFLFFLKPAISQRFGINLILPETTCHYRDFTIEAIEERKKSNQRKDDVLQLLLDQHNAGKISNDELIANCVNFFIAGHDTTNATLIHATYLLALNPEIQEKAFEEIVNVLKTTNGKFTWSIVSEFHYISKIFTETLRLYPPAPRVERQCNRDYVLGDTGITIPKDMIVSIPIYAMHRDEKLYPNPDTFDPERFPGGRITVVNKRGGIVYLPFGAGRRGCVGVYFTRPEMTTCLVHVIANFRIKRCDKTKVPLDYHKGNGLLVPKDAFVEMEPREYNPLIE